MFFTDEWERHPDVETIKWVQANSGTDEGLGSARVSSSSEEEEDDTGSPSTARGSRDEDDLSEEESNMPVTVNKFGALSTDA